MANKREIGQKKEETKEQKTKESGCISRESNAGPIDGNDGFYH